MTVLNVQNLSFWFGERELFSKVNFDIKEKEKVGFVGANGVGKTTMFNLIRGVLEPTEGEVIKSKDVRVGYMEQHTCSEKNRTLLDEILSVFDYLSDLERQIEEVNLNLLNGEGD